MRRRYWFVRGGVFALRFGFVSLRQRLAENRGCEGQVDE
jgi:hypothetical protein